MKAPEWLFLISFIIYLIVMSTFTLLGGYLLSDGSTKDFEAKLWLTFRTLDSWAAVAGMILLIPIHIGRHVEGVAMADRTI